MRSDARKRHQHAEHPDPTVCQLIRGARVVTLNDCALQLSLGIDDTERRVVSEHDQGYVDGWNAATRFYAAAFTTAATEIQATP